MTKSAFHQYDPCAHADMYGWLWIEDEHGEMAWELVDTFEGQDGEWKLYLVDSAQVEEAAVYTGRPFLRINPPPAPGDDPPGFILTIDDRRGLRHTFAWKAEGCRSGKFAEKVLASVEHAINGCRVQ